jgi:hypothetical protein
MTTTEQEVPEHFFYHDWIDAIDGSMVRTVKTPTIEEGEHYQVTLVVKENEGLYFVSMGGSEFAVFEIELDAIVFGNRLCEALNGGLDQVLMNLAADSFKWRTATMVAATFMVEEIEVGKYWEKGTESDQIFTWLEQSAINALDQNLQHQESKQ